MTTASSPACVGRLETQMTRKKQAQRPATNPARPKGGLVSKKACPFCGDPHPLFVKDETELEEDPLACPECEHWIGRYDTDGGCHWDRDSYVDQVNFGLVDPEDGAYSGRLAFLNEVELPPLVEDHEEAPDRDALEAAFGHHLPLAEAAYQEWMSRGDPGEIFDALVKRLGIQTLEIWGRTGPMDSWISYEYYARHSNAALDRIRDTSRSHRGRRRRASDERLKAPWPPAGRSSTTRSLPRASPPRRACNSVLFPQHRKSAARPATPPLNTPRSPPRKAPPRTGSRRN